MNHVTLVGNVGKDAEIKEFESGKQKTTISLATSRAYKDKSGEFKTETQWHNLIIWSAKHKNGESFPTKAERAADKIKSGYKLVVEGELVYNEVKDENGKVTNRYTDILVSKWEIVYKPQPASTTASEGSSEGSEDSTADDLPF